jgi:uncharacterized membrane protein YdbT with pleckstrin-like domain
MRYPDSALLTDEVVVFDVHHHAVVLLRPVLLAVAFFTVWIALLAVLEPFRKDWALLIVLIIFLFLIGYVAWRVVVWTRVNLVLTDRRLIYEYGVLTRHSQEIHLSKIIDVSSTQMVLGRLLNYGDLLIKTAPDSRESAFFDLPHPERLRLDITERTHTVTSSDESRGHFVEEVARAVTRERPTAELPALPAERPPIYSEIVDQIERLDILRERGVLSEAEFSEAKEGLLSRLKKEPGQ